MGSATREAVAAAKAALAGQPGAADLALGEELFAAGRVIGDSSQLRSVLSDPSADPAAKTKIIDGMFGSLSTKTRGFLSGLVHSRWSSQKDLLAGIEELGLRVMALSVDGSVDIAAELFAFGTVVSSSAELELAIGSKLGQTEAKAQLVQALLGGKASKQTVAIVRHLVQQPRGRRINALLAGAAAVVADQAGLAIATVTTATPLTADQLSRLQARLSASYGRPLKVNLVIDPELIGGVRVQIGDDIIDGSVATRLGDLKLQLAG
jgi:F-type H+-transporting ATPase subunit delta